jgi:hypothetical protein
MTKRILTLLALSAALFAGCSGGGRVAPPALTRTNPENITRGAASPGPTVSPLTYYGGPVLRYPKVYVTYWNWASDPSGEKPYLESFLNGFEGSKLENILTQYYDTTGSITNSAHQFKGTWSDPHPEPSPAALTDADFAAAAIRSEGHFGYNSSAIYLIAITSDPPQFTCASHGSTTDSTGRLIAYILYPYQGAGSCDQNAVNPGSKGLLDGVGINATHEIAEAITNPFGSAGKPGWISGEDANVEIADACQQYLANVTLSTGTFAVQALDSNASGTCTFSYP